MYRRNMQLFTHECYSRLRSQSVAQNKQSMTCEVKICNTWCTSSTLVFQTTNPSLVLLPPIDNYPCMLLLGFDIFVQSWPSDWPRRKPGPRFHLQTQLHTVMRIVNSMRIEKKEVRNLLTLSGEIGGMTTHRLLSHAMWTVSNVGA